MTKRWVTFDLDGTLMENPFVSWVFPEIETMVRETLGENVSIKDKLAQEHKRLLGSHQLVAAYNWDEILKNVLLKLQLSIDIDVEHLVKKHSVQPKVFLLEDNVIDVLHSLKSDGFHLAAVTNGFLKYQQPVMDVLGLTPLFDRIITPDQCGYAKPDVRMLKTLDREGNIEAHVGDRIDHDVSSANELGMTSVWFNHELPTELRNIAPHERANHAAVLSLVKEKWQKEKYGAPEPFPEKRIPALVIHSLHELVDYLK